MDNLLKNALLVGGGVAAGVITGILTAPKSGKETREDIRLKMEELQSKIEGLGGEARSDIDKKINELKESLKEVEAQINN